MDSHEKYIKYKTKYLKSKMYGGKHISKNNSKMNTKTTERRYHLSEPWFTLISLGLKTVEGRKNSGKFKELDVGEVVEWFNEDFMLRTIKTVIIAKRIYPTFREYLASEGIEKTVTGQPDMEHALSVYYKYYSEEDVIDCGVVAFEMELIH
jgi:ASC-1-like (ASCH) protein